MRCREVAPGGLKRDLVKGPLEFDLNTLSRKVFDEGSMPSSRSSPAGESQVSDRAHDVPLLLIGSTHFRENTPKTSQQASSLSAHDRADYKDLNDNVSNAERQGKL